MCGNFIIGLKSQHTHNLRVDGHSDAEVLIYPKMDTLLGALSLGDIGKIFPSI